MLEFPGHGPGDLTLGALWRSSCVDTCGFCARSGRVVGQQQVRSTLQVTPRLAPAESPAHPHPYTHVFSGLLGTVVGNSSVGYPPGPGGCVESGSMYFTTQTLYTLGCCQEFLCQCLPVYWWPGSGTMCVYVPPWPLCTLSCFGEFLYQCVLVSTHDLGSGLAHMFLTVLWGAALVTPA